MLTEYSFTLGRLRGLLVAPAPALPIGDHLVGTFAALGPFGCCGGGAGVSGVVPEDVSGGCGGACGAACAGPAAGYEANASGWGVSMSTTGGVHLAPSLPASTGSLFMIRICPPCAISVRDRWFAHGERIARRHRYPRRSVPMAHVAVPEDRMAIGCRRAAEIGEAAQGFFIGLRHL